MATLSKNLTKKVTQLTYSLHFDILRRNAKNIQHWYKDFYQNILKLRYVWHIHLAQVKDLKSAEVRVYVFKKLNDLIVVGRYWTYRLGIVRN